MAVDPAVMDATTTTETVDTTASPNVLELMREGLKETTPPGAGDTPVEGEAEAPPDGEATEGTEAPKPASSRRAKTVEREVGKVLTEAEQKIKDAEDRAQAAEAKAAELQAKVEAATQEPTAEAERVRLETLQHEYQSWIGDQQRYQEAQRLSRMDPDSPEWDFDKHKEAVAFLETADDRRKWAGILTTNAKRDGSAEMFDRVSKDLIETLAADLPEDKREAYTTHKDGIPGAVRFYAETVYAPKIEALEATIAERDAEIERLRTAGGGSYRSPAPGGPASPPSGIDYSRMTAEEMMAADLREQARQSRRGR